MKRGQLFSTDVVVATVGFLFIILAYIFLSTHVFTTIHEVKEREQLFSQAQHALRGLTLTPGNPSNWTNLTDVSTAFTIGVADSLSLSDVGQVHYGKRPALERSMGGWDVAKVKKLVSLNSTSYEDFKSLLGIRSADFFLEFFGFVDNNFVSQHKIGLEPTPSARQVVRLDSYGHMNASWSRAVIQVWTNCLEGCS